MYTCAVFWCVLVDSISLTAVIHSSIGILVYRAETSSMARILSSVNVWFLLLSSIILGDGVSVLSRG